MIGCTPDVTRRNAIAEAFDDGAAMIALMALCVAVAAPSDAPAQAPVSAPALLEQPAAVEMARGAQALRIAVTELEASGVERRHARVLEASVLAELRKLDHTSVIGTREIKQMLAHEAQKQLLGCSADACLTEIADALGVDVLVVGAVTNVGDETVFSLKRLDQRRAQVTAHVERRIEVGNGEELLVAVGGAVAELFADIPLKRGAQRGVAKEMALRLNPPPLPTPVFYSGLGLTTASLTAAGVLGGLNVASRADAQRYKVQPGYQQAVFDEKNDTIDSLAYGFYACAGSAVAFGVATTVSAFFTDFWGYADMNDQIASVE